MSWAVNGVWNRHVGGHVGIGTAAVTRTAVVGDVTSAAIGLPEATVTDLGALCTCGMRVCIGVRVASGALSRVGGLVRVWPAVHPTTLPPRVHRHQAWR